MAKHKHKLMTVVQTDGSSQAYMIDAKEEYNEVSKAVGGMIERVGYFKKFGNRRAVAWVNEEGIPRGLTLNPWASAMWSRQYPMATQLYGPLVVIQTPE